MTTRDKTPVDSTGSTNETLEGAQREENAVVPGPHQDTTDGISLLTDEIVLTNVHPSWSNWPLSLGLAGFFGLVALSNLAQFDVSAFFGSTLVTVLIVGYVQYARKQSRYIVTNQRVLKNVGLLRNASGETRIKDIRSLATKQGLLERLFGKGSVKIDSSGADGHLEIEGVKDYEQVANEIREQQRRLE